MKLARFVLKIVGASLMLAGAVCCVIGCWDMIMKLFQRVFCGRPEEYDDFADVD